MSDATRRPTVSHWFACSCDLLREMEAAGLDAPAVVLNVAAWTYAAVNTTDGVLTTRETARLPYATPRRRHALETAGFWRSIEDGRIELEGYLDINETRARIQARRAQARERQHRARERAAGEASDDESGAVDDSARHAAHHAARHGPLPSPSPSPSPRGEKENVNDGPEDQERAVEGGDAGTPEAAAASSRGPRSRSNDAPSSSERAKGKGRRRDRERDTASTPAMPRWEDKPWEPVRDNWEARGLTYEPTAPQRRLLWPVPIEFPDLVGDWVAEAPVDDSSSYGVVAHVLAAAGVERVRHRLPELFAALSEEERARWLEAEEGWGIYRNPMRTARYSGEGLPAVGPEENPFRVALPEMVKQREELFSWPTKTKPTDKSAEGADGSWTNI